MNIGDKVQSRLYAGKGVGTIIGFSTLFGEQYAEVLFQDGSTLSAKIDDLSVENDPTSLLKNGQVQQPSIFYAQNMLLRLDANISENTIVTSTNYKIEPLPHQLLAVDFVINRFEPRSLIADEVGLGKTIEAILVYQEFKLRGIAKKVLVVVPSGLVLQWHEELLDKFNEKFIVYTKDYIRALKQSYGEETNVWKLHDKIIASIDSIKPLKIDEKVDVQERKRRDWHNRHVFEDITTAGFDMVIIDEAHKLSKYGDGRESARFKLGKKLSETIPILLLLTATPHQGDEDLFLNLLRLIDPVLFASRASLTPGLVREVTVRNKKRAVVDFDGKRIFKHRITSLIEIARKIPEQQEEIELYQYVTEYTGKYYNLAKRDNNQILMLLVMLYQRMVSSSSFAILEAMKRRRSFLQGESAWLERLSLEDFEISEFAIDELLSQKVSGTQEDVATELTFVETCIRMAEKLTVSFKDIKFRKLIEIIDEIKRREKKPDLKFIVFTEFRATQDAIIRFLSRLGYSCSYINGSLSREEKMAQVEAFRTKNQIMVSTDAGGEGINLQFCYCMFNFDLPWNPSRLEQRIGRIDRIGQKHHTLIFNFHLTDTIEDHVRRILEIKLGRIKTQFGEDKFADVLTLIQDEFSFDQIYVDAIKLRRAEEKQLEVFAERIYQRAKEVLEKDDLLLPFSQFKQDAKGLVNTQLNKIIKHLTLHYLAYKGIQVNRYRDEPEFYYFNNPFPSMGEATIYRNVTFENAQSLKKAKVEFINLQHPLLMKIRHHIEANPHLGCVTALRMAINKFKGMNGFWFVYRLFITNHENRKKTALVSVFMEDESFHNNRISNYLESHYPDNVSLIQNYTYHQDIHAVAAAALKFAEEKAIEIFTATKLTWLNEIEKHERKFEDYFHFKQNAYSNIQIENIRESKLKLLESEKQAQWKRLQLQRNIVPKMELYQIAYVEFV